MKMSRRTVLTRAATITGLAVAGAVGERAAAQAKVSQAEAKYQVTPNGGQACNGCANFTVPAACKVVDGNISPNGWCKLFKAKPK
jgi:hypothetical protein